MMASIFQSKTLRQPAEDQVDCESTVKLILLGETNAGKTSIALRFANDDFSPYSESTIGASFFEKSIISNESSDGESSPNRRKVIFNIWDTAGQEKYHALASIYYRGAGAAVLVYDISRPGSFSVLQNWAEELKGKGPEGILIIVCGNKVDLEATGDRKVSSDDAKSYADGIGAHYIETSARDNINVRELFEYIANQIPIMPNIANANESAGNTQIQLGATELRNRACC
jgi:small GTP-binding protein